LKGKRKRNERGKKLEKQKKGRNEMRKKIKYTIIKELANIMVML
jgi:hypothetical protein